jgi:cytidine deaminase
VTGAAELDDEDRKLLVLARGASLRAHVPHTGVAAGAAVRDADGRTYAGAAVENADPALCTSALRAAVAAAASSGARRFEAAVVVTAGEFDPQELGLLSEFGPGVPVLVAGPDGTVHSTLAS